MRRKLPQILTQEEIKRLFALPRFRKKGKQSQKMQIMLMYYCGLRVSEMLNLRVENINLDEDTLKVVNGKFGKDRLCIIPLQLKPHLEEFIKGKYSGNLFYTKANNIQKILKRIGIEEFNKRLHPHMLRHSFATHILEKTGNLELVRVSLGHSSLQSTIVYTHLSTGKRKEALIDLFSL